MAARKPSKSSEKGRVATAGTKFAYDAALMRLAVLVSNDGYLMREYSRQIAEALRAEYGDIDEFTYDGASTSLADVLDELRSYGLIQRHKLVILDNADEFLKEPKDDDGEAAGPQRASFRPAMERYAAAPVDHATLLMRAATWRKGRIDKEIERRGVVFRAEAPTEERAIGWVIKRCAKEHGCEIAADAAALLVAQVGAELARLDVEIGKLAAYVGPGGGRSITREVVGEMVGLSREEKAWAIQSAIATGDPRRALAKLEEFRPIDPGTQVLIAWSIMDLLRKVHACSRLLAQGENPFTAAKQLKLWGDTQTAVLAVAKRLSPQAAADLFNRAVRTDQNNKSGVGDPVRSLEGLTLQIADTIGGCGSDG